MVAGDPRGTITRADFGRVGDQDVSLYTMVNASGCSVKISNYGATITELHVPDRAGQLADVVLGFESLEEYVASRAYFGAIVGRVANRIKNGRFELDGSSYELARNDGPDHLHGGITGFDRVVWSATPARSLDGPVLELSYVSKDGEDGYPGTLKIFVTYRLTNDVQLMVDVRATTDRSTIVNAAQHSYFNLAGHDSGSVLAQELKLNANEYTASDPDPGVTRPVEGSAFDFTEFKPIGQDLAQLDNQPRGYDHNFVMMDSNGELREVARARDPKSGRELVMESDQPGLQFYCGSFLDGRDRGKGATYEQYAGFCLESQKFPYAINVPTWRNQVVLRAGELYRHRMVYRFSAERGLA